MLEAASLLSAFFAFTSLYYAARPAWIPYRFPGKASRAFGPSLRVIALLAAALSVHLWAKVESATAGVLVFLVAMMSSASIFVLLVPLAPRFAFCLAAACPVLIAALVFVGGRHAL